MFKNEEDFKSGRKFQLFNIEFMFNEDEESVVRDYIMVENSILTTAFPIIKTEIESMVASYLREQKLEEAIKTYGLESFEVQVQDISRTFIDKVYAICDYYLDNNASEHSRHIYDLHMLFDRIKPISSLKELIDTTREERKKNIKSISITEEHNIQKLLTKIIDEGFYKRDYEVRTKLLLYDQTVRRHITAKFNVRIYLMTLCE